METTSATKQIKGYMRTLQAYQLAVNEASIVSITDLKGRIIYVNDKFIEISMYESGELIGNTHRIINSGYHPPEYFAKLWETITQGKPWRGEMKNKAKDGSYYWVDTVITPVMDKHNKVFQYLSVRNLITAQKENEEKLIRSRQELLRREQQLKDAQQVAKTGSWYLDISRNSLEWSEETYNIFEIHAGTPMTYESFLANVHPGDIELVDKSWNNALKGAPYDIEHRIMTPSGEKWVRERASLEFDESHNLNAGVGTVQDISGKKQIEDILKESEALYKNVFNNSPFPKGILRKDNLKFLQVNETATKVYGYTREEFLRLTAFDIRVTEEHDQLREQLASNRYTEMNIRTHRKKNGDILKVESFITEIIYKREPCYLITINDVTERLKLQDQLLHEKLTRQKEISKASIEAQEKNRAEIGRELHDNINQLLVASNIYLKNIAPVKENEKIYLKKSMEINREAINEIRKLSHSLAPPSLRELSLKESIEDLILNFAITKTIIDFNIRINENELPEGLKINIYRILQEQFNNIVKYADATQISVNIRQHENVLSLEIIDNGKGLDKKQKPKGIGLSNIIHRAETYNGKTTIESSPGSGFRLYIEFIL